MKKIIIILMLLLSPFLLFGQQKTFKDILVKRNIWITDATGNDSLRIYNDGDTMRFQSDNPFQMNQNLKLAEEKSLEIGSVRLSDSDGCLGTDDFHAHGKDGVAGYFKLNHGTTPAAHNEADHSILWVGVDDKLYFEKADGTDIEVPLTFETIEFTSTFDNTLITLYSGATTLVYEKPNPAQGETAINGGTVTKVGKLLAYQFHVVFDEDDEFVLEMDASLIPGEIVSMSVVGDDGSLAVIGLRSPAGNYIRFNRDDAIDVDLDCHLIVWVDGGTETAVIPVGTFIGAAGSIPFSNGTSIVEDNANLFYDDGNNRVGIGTNIPVTLLHIQENDAGAQEPLSDAQLGIENNTNTRISMISGTGNFAQLVFGDAGDANVGYVQYDHNGDYMSFGTGNTGEKVRITSTGDIYSIAWTDYGGTSTIVGWSGTPAANIWYKKIGNLVYVNYYIDGTSNATSVSFTLPYTSVSSTSFVVRTACQIRDNGSFLATPGYLSLSPNTSTATVYTDFAGAAWTNTNTKTVGGQFWYEAQ